MDKDFLIKLLTTPSPSGDEVEIQKIYKNYLLNFVDKVETDLAGDVIGVVNPNGKRKVLLAGHCDEIAFVVSYIDQNGYLFLQKVGGISYKIAPGMKVDILGKNGVLKGVIGVNAEHHGGLKDKFSIEDVFVDCGAKDREEIEKMVSIGDYVVYDREPTFLLNNRLSARGLDNRTGAFIVAEVLKRVSKESLDVAVYGVSTVGEETNMGGAFFASSFVKPDIALIYDVTFATDYPSVDQKKYGKVDLDGGPVLAKGGPINKKINSKLEECAKELNIKLQYELTPARTGTDGDRVRFTNSGVPISLISLPLRYMHAPVETVSLKDIEQEIELTVQFLKSLKGDENWKPLD